MAEIHMGALSPKLSDQIPGLPDHFDRDADAITRLKVRGLMTDSEGDKARKRLVKAIEKHLKGK